MGTQMSYGAGPGTASKGHGRRAGPPAGGS